MKVKELINVLSEFDEDLEVNIVDKYLDESIAARDIKCLYLDFYCTGTKSPWVTIEVAEPAE